MFCPLVPTWPSTCRDTLSSSSMTPSPPRPTCTPKRTLGLRWNSAYILHSRRSVRTKVAEQLAAEHKHTAPASETHPHALIRVHAWASCLCLGPREIRRFILQCINHHRAHHPGKRIHGGFTQGTHRKNHLIPHVSCHLNVSSLFEQAVEFDDWVKAPFVFSFLMSCFMGYVTTVHSESSRLCLHGDVEPILPLTPNF